jgi:hypothetical protein
MMAGFSAGNAESSATILFSLLVLNPRQIVVISLRENKGGLDALGTLNLPT